MGKMGKTSEGMLLFKLSLQGCLQAPRKAFVFLEGGKGFKLLLLTFYRVVFFRP